MQNRPEAATANDKEGNPNTTKVFVWKMKPGEGKIGHAAIQVGNYYLSIWPKYFPALGPATLIPLTGQLATSLEDDMRTEGELTRLDPENESFQEIEDRRTRNGISPPDEIHTISGLDTKAMQESIEEIKDEVARGQRRYQLFPAFNLFRFFTEAGAYLSYDPVDIQQQQKNTNRYPLPYSANNCTTLVSDILKEGGMEIKKSKSPMELTPDDLSDKIARHRLSRE